jgi:hypothetical protein
MTTRLETEMNVLLTSTDVTGSRVTSVLAA